MHSLEEYARIFARLTRAPRSGADTGDTLKKAPHKPLLLLSVLDLFADGAVQDGRVRLSPDLGDLFQRYWYRVMPPDAIPRIWLPFFHLHNDGDFWQLVATPGNERELTTRDALTSLRDLDRLVLYAQLDPDLVMYMTMAESRTVLRDVLIQRYFAPATQARLLEQATINAGAFEYSRTLLAPRIAAEALEEYAARPAVRDQGFRRAVVTAYDHRCAMCGIRILTMDGHAAVEAAHIHAWSESKNDMPTNGLALCRLCHWSFDEGLLGADRLRAILVSPYLSTQRNIPGHLAQLADRPLFPPANVQFSPDVTALAWHQRRVFRA
jgi:putative restriction endonuclease